MSESEEKVSGYKLLIKDKKSKKLLLFAGVAIVLGIVYVTMFSTTQETASKSRVATPPNRGGAYDATDNLTPAYEEALRSADRQRIEEAQSRGDSAMPTPIIGSSDHRPPLIFEEEEVEEEEVDPRPALPSTAQVQPILLPEPVPPPPLPPVRQPPPRRDATPLEQPAPEPGEPAAPPPPPYTGEEYERLRNYMASLMGEPPAKQFGVASTSYFYSGDASSSGGRGAAGEGQLLGMHEAPSGSQGGQASAAEQSRTGDPLLDQLPLPGEILYAEMISRANSDAPGPVLARVLEGPFAGATVIGNFSVAQEALVIQFTSMTIRETRDGEAVNRNIPINTVAVDVEHIGTAMATDVDRHMFERVALTFATSFIEGMAQAITNSGSTTTHRSDGSTTTHNDPLNTREQVIAGAGTAAGEVGNILNDYYGNKPTTVIVESGTPLGLLFL